MYPGRKSILIVDDSPIIISGLLGMLEGLDEELEIRHTGSYAGAMALILQALPDIAVLDVNLPDKSGIDLLRFLKKNFPAVKVIMLTNQSSRFYRTVCEFIGADHFVDKSTEFELIPHLLGLS